MTNQTNNTNPIVIIARQNGGRLYYTGKAGQAYVSSDIGDAFYYETQAEADRKVEIFNRAKELTGLTFRSHELFRFEGFKVGTKVAAFDHEPMEGRRDRYAFGTIVEANPDGTVDRPFGHYIVDVELDMTFQKNGGRDQIAVPMETSMDFQGRIKLGRVSS